jgi:spore maturation protein CgeB
MTERVLFVASLYNNGIEAHGLSYEYYNLYKPLEQAVGNVETFDFMQKAHDLGRQRMNESLLEVVKRDRPQFVLVVPFMDEFEPGMMDELKKYTTTVAYFFDDMWRREYSEFWAPHFTYVTTSDVNGVRRFGEAGSANAIYSPFGCNHEIFVKMDCAKIYDVAFVGQFHPYRAWWIRQIRRAGIDVGVWGHGWGTGHVGEEDLVRIFNQARINLNLSNSTSWDLRYVLALRRPILETLRIWKRTARSLKRGDSKDREQVKGRHFEISACGGFQLSFYVEGLERYYRIGEEIALYASPDDLIETIRYYLKHDEKREGIALRAYERTSREHTMVHRFRDLLGQTGHSDLLVAS